MLKRKMTDILLDWKNDPQRKSLMVIGARQVGKTFTISDFGKENYRSYVYINFEETPSLQSIFSGNKNIDMIMQRMSVEFPDVDFIPKDTLIFLDEIQNCPDARVALKFFTMDGRYDVIASGSLLGVRYREVSSYPVGYETTLDMHSLDFEEFLWARGIKAEMVDMVKGSLANKEPLDDYVLERFNAHHREYMIVGGMPEVVMTFNETNHFGKVLKAQRQIVNGYMDDATKYAKPSDKGRVRSTFRSIPVQLAKRNKKFVYSDVDGDVKGWSNVFGGSLSWLYDAGIIRYCFNLSELALPLAQNTRENSFKIYMRDTGLLMSMMEDGISSAILNEDVFVNEGAIVENVTADMLVKSGFELTYFERKGTLEIDFILNINGIVTAIEVKSGNNKQSKSLDSIKDRYGVNRRIKLERTNVHVDEDDIEHYPLFASAFLREMNDRGRIE